MLKTVVQSSNKKTGPLAVTYRAGKTDPFGTCPNSCALMPANKCGTVQIDSEYLAAVEDSVPRRGKAWTYSHFPAAALPMPKPGKTVINVSCDTVGDAVLAVESGRPAVLAAAADTAESWPRVLHGVQFVRCPAELSESFTCTQCGNGSPLCARGDRNYVVVFVGHGPHKKKIGKADRGGCYGTSGPVMIQWKKAGETGAENDAAAVRRFAASLPPGSLLRHHVVGDMGAAV